ncbi:MAG TPA: universal stress protein [Verrucomicrobiae bacterium]|jgi:nucleotide-binding universal stress UspA family protein|nr:universal stress protein [Verrucomicrobiae bacterium]
MAKTYLVPVDFSRGSEAALDRALKLAKEDRAKLVLLHVISINFAFPLQAGFTDIIEIMEENAKKNLRSLLRRKRLRPGQVRSLLVRGISPADDISAMAKKLRAAMIIMGSHGRTGFKRLMIGSVAERTLRQAQCPVLIVKK